MAKTVRYHFYLKDSQSKEPTPINFVMNKGSFRKKFSVGEKMLPLWWDIENECAIEDSRQKKAEKALAKRVNRNLARLREELDDLFQEYNGVDKLTPNHTDGEDLLEELFARAAAIIGGTVKANDEEDKASRKTPSEFFDEFIVFWSRTPNKRTKIIPKAETIWNYKNTIRRYKDYVSDNGLKDRFTIFDEDFETNFTDYLMNEQELVENTIVGSLSQLKVMLRRAYEKGYLRNSSFLDWSSKTINFTKVYLTDAELNTIYNLQITDQMRKDNKIGSESHILESRDLFILSSRTGLRYSDLRHLNSATWDMEEGKESLTIITQKTREKIKIPLHKQVIELYNKYGGKLPQVIDKSKYNEQIRLCTKLAGICSNVETFEWANGRPIICAHLKYELVSSHTGRRSFATNLFIKCKSAHYVMSLTGHKTEESFKRYICVDQEQMAEMVRKFINLDYEGEDTDTFKKLLGAIRDDTLTMDRQQRRIDSLERTAKEDHIWSNLIVDDLTTRLNNLLAAWGSGLTMDQYEQFEKESDVIADWAVQNDY